MKGEFEVEPGFGSEKDEFLKDHKIKTFLILDKSHQTKDYESNNINGSKSDGMVSVNEPKVILSPANLQKRRQSPVQFITSRWADKLPRLSLTKCMQNEYWKPEIPFSNVSKDHNFLWRTTILWHQVNYVNDIMKKTIFIDLILIICSLKVPKMNIIDWQRIVQMVLMVSTQSKDQKYNNLMSLPVE